MVKRNFFSNLGYALLESSPCKRDVTISHVVQRHNQINAIAITTTNNSEDMTGNEILCVVFGCLDRQI